MADWKQITARIRRARTGKDPAGQLSNLFEKTNDAMVAFELARFFETSGQNPDAAKWYCTAAEKFRRADWKTKAQDAATRLAGLPPGEPLGSPLSAPAVVAPEPALPFIQNAEVFETLVAPESAAVASGTDSESESDAESSSSTAVSTDGTAGPRGRRRRGRRGGRNRRKRGSTGDAAPVPSTPSHRSTSTSTEHAHRSASSPAQTEPPPSRFDRTVESPALRLPVDPGAADASGPGLRGRYGDPGLSSRLSLLEMQFRRLLTCSPVKLDDTHAAPAGPGVFLLSDSDLTSYYYVEACQTLRIAIPNLLRGGSTRRGVDSIKPQLADHLGIAETRVGKYLADHCVVRWLQLDEGASHFAHFVISVLRPVLNE
jgi:hypothetical protein